MIRIIFFLLYGNIEQENFVRAKEQVAVHNRQMLKILALIASFFFYFCCIIGIFISSMHHKIPAYFFGGTMSLAMYLLDITAAKKSIFMTNLSMYLFDIELLAFGIALTILNAPEQLTISLIALLMIVPLLFTDRPYRVNFIESMAIIIYMILAYHFKPHELLPLDYVDVVLFGMMGMIVGTFMTRIKYERYIYALDAEKQALINKEQAEKDALTGLYNRHAFNDMLTAYEKKTTQDLYAVVMYDINALKETNDTIGHDAGDELICAAAHCITQTFGKYGKVYRTGGDEFVAILEQEDLQVGQTIQTFKEMQEQWNGHYIHGLNISFGYVQGFADSNESMKEILKRAEILMYEDKARYYQKQGIERRRR